MGLGLKVDGLEFRTYCSGFRFQLLVFTGVG